MNRLNCVVYGTLFLVVAAAGQAHAQSVGNNDAEIAALKQQLRLMEQKLDKLQNQTTANAAAAANANAKAGARISAANASGAYPVKSPIAPADGCEDAEQPADNLHRG
jgi:phosphate-selective porin OprO and OprP